MVPSLSSLRRLYALLRAESGVAVPTVLVVVMIGLGMAAAAGTAAISAQRGSVRDEDSKRALAAADAGALRALYRQNRLLTTASLPCVVVGAQSGTLELAAADAGGWCAEQAGTIGDATYGYWVSAPVLTAGTGVQQRSEVEMVSMATSDDVSRRISLTSSALTGAGLLSGASVMGLDGVSLNSNAEVNGNVATNGDIVMNSNATLCGNAQYGVGQGLLLSSNAHQCPGYGQAEGEISLPAVEQGDVPTTNSNGRFFTQDIKQGNGVTWNATTRSLSLNSNSALTLGGTDYSFCKLELNSNSTLYIAQGARVRIFFDAPENCIDPSDGQPYTESDEPVTQFIMNSNTKITNTSGDPTSAAFLMVGSETISTIAQLNSNSHVNIDLILYAPLTDLILDSNSTFRGALAGKSVSVNSNATIESDNRVSDFEVPIRTIFEAGRYVECAGGGPGTTPDSGC